jgi:predicted transcriptional regulator
MATSIKIDDDLRARVQALASRKQRSAHSIMREAISAYVTREEARESFRNEALEAWAAFQETGQHVTGGEVSDWLKTWGMPDETDIVECHD